MGKSPDSLPWQKSACIVKVLSSFSISQDRGSEKAANVLPISQPMRTMQDEVLFGLHASLVMDFWGSGSYFYFKTICETHLPHSLFPNIVQKNLVRREQAWEQVSELHICSKWTVSTCSTLHFRVLTA